MGYFSNLAIEVEEALWRGATVEQIARAFGITDEEVREIARQMDEADHDPVPHD